MLKLPRRLTAAVLAGAALFSLSACGKKEENTAADQLVMTVNGNEITAGEYAASYLYSKATIEAVMYQYGLTDLWNTDYADSYKEQLNQVARNQAAALYIIPAQFEAAGLSLTEEEEESCKNTNALMRDQIKSWGFTEEMTTELARTMLMQEKLDDYYFGEGGAMAPEESEIEEYFQNNYWRAKHILISTRDDDSQPITDEDELAKRLETANEVYQKAAAGEDFDALIEEYGEDPGMASYPDGYVFTDGEMVAEFQEATAALAENNISAPVKSDFGWHIIQRLPLREEDRASVYSEIVTAITGMDLDRLLEQWLGEAEITTEPLLDEITFDNVADYKYSVD